jgi:nicotinamidase-related amidase
MRSWLALPALACLSCIALLGPAFAQDAKQPVLKLRLRSQAAVAEKGAPAKEAVLFHDESWPTKQTAIIVCDVWDAHHCLNAVRRLDELVPVMNRMLEKARDQGVLIIHAPSSCMAPYKEHPARKRAIDAPMAKNLPKGIDQWCYKIPAEEKGKYPIDQSDGGEDDDLAEHAEWHAKLKAMGRNPKAPWLSQHAGIKMSDADVISDSGVEIWNVLEAQGIKNVILVGVHTNMCVLGRPFGLRQMAKNGKNVVLMRDMTDTMYNPKMPPMVSHFQGTALIVEHIEKFVCPTMTSDQIIGGKPFRFKGDTGK